MSCTLLFCCTVYSHSQQFHMLSEVPLLPATPFQTCQTPRSSTLSTDRLCHVSSMLSHVRITASSFVTAYGQQLHSTCGLTLKFSLLCLQADVCASDKLLTDSEVPQLVKDIQLAAAFTADGHDGPAMAAEVVSFLKQVLHPKDNLRLAAHGITTTTFPWLRGTASKTLPKCPVSSM